MAVDLVGTKTTAASIFLEHGVAVLPGGGHTACHDACGDFLWEQCTSAGLKVTDEPRYATSSTGCSRGVCCSRSTGLRWCLTACSTCRCHARPKWCFTQLELDQVCGNQRFQGRTRAL